MLTKIFSALFLLLVLASPGLAAAPAGCEAETSLTARTDILKCEGWEAAGWNNNGWYQDQGDTGNALDGRRFNRFPMDDTRYANFASSAVITGTGCLSGNCMRVNMLSYLTAAGGGWVGMNWIIPGQGGCSHSTLGCVPQQDVYARYYLKLSPNFDPEGYGVKTGERSGGGGKFPGLADATNGASGTPSIQCGNGGEAPVNGTECWSARTTFQLCQVTYNGVYNGCAQAGNVNASTRFGFYPYMYDGSPVGIRFTSAYWDDDGRGNADGPCDATYGFGGGKNYTNVPPFCGIGNMGLDNDRWYEVEIHTKMNDPGVANGILEGWLDGVLRYRKTNVNYRNPGHNNIGVRQFWLDIFTGGTGVGMKEDMYVLFDQMVVATQRIGSFQGTTPVNQSQMVPQTQDPGTGTGGFSRGHYLKPLGCYLSLFGAGGVPPGAGGDNSIRCLTPHVQVAPNRWGQWMTLFPSDGGADISSIGKRDNYLSFYISWLDELWMYGGSYISPQELTQYGFVNYQINYAGRMSFANCRPTATPNCAQWVALSRFDQGPAAFASIVENYQVLGAWHTDNAAACNDVVEKCMWGWGYNSDGDHYLLEKNVSRAQGSICNSGAAVGTKTHIACVLPKNPRNIPVNPSLDDQPTGSGTTPSWRQQAMNVLAPGPDAARCFFIVGTMAFTHIDAQGNVGNFRSVRDAWIYNCTTMAWTQVTSPPTVGSGGSGNLATPLMVFDKNRNQWLLQADDHISAYNLATGNWTDVSPPSGTGFNTFNSYGAFIDNADMFIIQDGNQSGTPGNAAYGVRAFTQGSLVGQVAPIVGFVSTSSNGSEASTAVNVTVALSQSSAQTVTVSYQATGGTATGGGVDYTLTPGTLTFAPGETVKSLPFTVVNDLLVEPGETIQLVLFNPNNASLGASTHLYTILDNDTTTIPGMRIGAGVTMGVDVKVGQ